MSICKRAAVDDADDAGAACRKRMRFGSTADYDRMGCLGEGGYGFVVKGRHRATGETVAIKFLRDNDDEERVDPGELLEEARFLEACGGNPHLVGFRGVVRDYATGDLGLVMEYVDGQSLDDFHLERCTDQPLPEATVRAFMLKHLEGTKKMHESNIVHRDIKPENILVGKGGDVVKICDLGVALSTSDAPPYSTAGTMMYRAPEMLLRKPDYDARVDTWSLGCVMAYIVTGGRRLFEEERRIPLLRRIFSVLGMPDETTWPGFTSLPLAAVAPAVGQQHSSLRELFSEEMLSSEGFEVLSGLLTCNPDKRLTAAAALELPWFVGVPPTPAATVGSTAVPVKIAPSTRRRKRVAVIKTLPGKRALIVPRRLEGGCVAAM